MWTALERHHKTHQNQRIIDLFDDPDRFGEFSCRADGLVFDYSKTTIDPTAKSLLIKLAHDRDVTARSQAMFAGVAINETEGRSVLHIALRNASDRPILVEGQDVMPALRDTLARMGQFARDVRGGKLIGATGKPFRDLVNIGIGGSDLGPVMAAEALRPYQDGPRLHFVSNIDPGHISDVLAQCDPETTMILVASKTFTTIETMTNAQTARNWLEQSPVGAGLSDHLAALSSAVDKAGEFGVVPERVFGFEDWVGGRYSIWGPIGLSLMMGIGPDHFQAFLDGAHSMDRHFVTADLDQNMPVLLALVGIWHRNICGYRTRAVLPYEQRLLRLPAYLQQLDMESNGKSVTMEGQPVSTATGPVVWGEPGTNGQHAFYQLIHQGTDIIPCEFMVARQCHEPDLSHQHKLLQANCLAQSEALMLGRDLDAARALMRQKGLGGAELERQAAHRVFAGNRPSTTLIYDRLDPRTLGQIIALYEHRVFVEGVIWGINSFDQWGVELGKVLATEMLGLIQGDSPANKDGSTQGLLDAIKSQ